MSKLWPFLHGVWVRVLWVSGTLRDQCKLAVGRRRVASQVAPDRTESMQDSMDGTRQTGQVKGNWMRWRQHCRAVPITAEQVR